MLLHTGIMVLARLIDPKSDIYCYYYYITIESKQHNTRYEEMQQTPAKRFHTIQMKRFFSAKSSHQPKKAENFCKCSSLCVYDYQS